jgi:hypothetical protein
LKIGPLNQLIEDFRKRQDELLQTKGNDYTMANEDRCHNFKEVAAFVGITPMQAWAVYYLKHVFAICTQVKYGKVQSEDIYERFIDANNYSYLGLALLEDQKNESTIEALKNSGVEEGPVAASSNEKQKVSAMPQEPTCNSPADSTQEYAGGRATRPLWPAREFNL